MISKMPSFVENLDAQNHAFIQNLLIINKINYKYLLLQVKEDSYMSKLLRRFLSRGRSI